MHASALLAAGAAVATLAFSFWPAPDETPGPELPPLVRLDPAPFSHRLDGDWQRNGRPADAPIETVTIPAAMEIMAMPVSTGAYMQCVAAQACAAPGGPTDRPDLPVTGVNWLDANAYARFLSHETGAAWRLPSDAEWAQAAGELFRDDALGIADDPKNPAKRWLAEYAITSARERERDRAVRPVGRVNVNSLGVHDIGGAVWEWTSTCLRTVKLGNDGSILRQYETCGIYIAEGLHRAAINDFVRDPKSGGCAVGVPPANLGFRLVREIR